MTLSFKMLNVMRHKKDDTGSYYTGHKKEMSKTSWQNSEPECNFFEVRDIFLFFSPDLLSMPKPRLSHKGALDKY